MHLRKAIHIKDLQSDDAFQGCVSVQGIPCGREGFVTTRKSGPGSNPGNTPRPARKSLVWPCVCGCLAHTYGSQRYSRAPRPRAALWLACEPHRGQELFSAESCRHSVPRVMGLWGVGSLHSNLHRTGIRSFSDSKHGSRFQKPSLRHDPHYPCKPNPTHARISRMGSPPCATKIGRPDRSRIDMAGSMPRQ